MMEVQMQASGLKNIQNRFRVMTKRAPKDAEAALVRLVMELAIEVRKEFFKSGLESQSGAYLNSFYMVQYPDRGGQPLVSLASLSPYAARLEFGFMGIDSLGRHYMQQPHPHWRPAVEIIRKRAPKEVYDAIISGAKAS